VIPLLWYLFEREEHVLVAAPTEEILRDKWLVDIRPAIESSRFSRLLPSRGAGSKKGFGSLIQFRNGATLKFMTGGGGDKSKAAYSAPVLFLTETDGMDTVSATSREADSIEQLEARLRAYGEDAITIAECTFSTIEGRTWQEIINGTDSAIMWPCPHCREYIRLQRENLKGWEEAETEEEAEQALWECPNCENTIEEGERLEALKSSVLIHKGQTVDVDGVVSGETPTGGTLGLRWGAADNTFVPAGMLGRDEWKAARAVDRDSAEKKMCQFVFGLPHEPDAEEIVGLRKDDIRKRFAATGRGIIPDHTYKTTVGVDVGAHHCHVVECAWREDMTGIVVDYWSTDRDPKNYERGAPGAITSALEEIHETLMQRDPKYRPNMGFIDSGYNPDVIYDFCYGARGRGLYMPVKGLSVGVEGGSNRGVFKLPEKCGKGVRWIGDQVYIKLTTNRKVRILWINVDYYKSAVHSALSVGLDVPGSLSFFASPSKFQHNRIAEHITAEVEEEVLQNGKRVRRWVAIQRANHDLDALVYAMAGARMLMMYR
jgi:phage terminase large subunit GpA-like protein